MVMLCFLDMYFGLATTHIQNVVSIQWPEKGRRLRMLLNMSYETPFGHRAR
jgi:hypothetical protein